MKKLKLNLEDLKVESFETNSSQSKLGTIMGQGGSQGCGPDLPETSQCTRNACPPGSEQATCNTCNPLWCYWTDPTCNFSCWATCVTEVPTCDIINCP
jgi:hypothetical protein